MGRRQTRQTDRWRKRHRELDRAFKDVKERFRDVPGVCGFGIGRKWKQSEGRFEAIGEANGRLCIVIMVDHKLRDKELASIPKRERIPKYVYVKARNRKKRRVWLDVVPLGGAMIQAGAHKHTWPTAGQIDVGRVFSFGLRSSDLQGPEFDNKEAELGTVGAVVQREGGLVFMVSAAHVFANLCMDDFNAPAGERCVGTQGRMWSAVAPHSFLPASVRGDQDLLTDAMMMALDGPLRPPGVSWPEEFDLSLATSADMDASIQSDGETGFVWVERQDGTRSKRPANILAGLDEISPLVCGGKRLHYGFVWPYKLRKKMGTIGGDSGAPVFIRSADGLTDRLLGFHFLYDPQMSLGYAVDAGLILKAMIGAEFNFLTGGA